MVTMVPGRFSTSCGYVVTILPEPNGDDGDDTPGRRGPHKRFSPPPRRCGRYRYSGVPWGFWVLCQHSRIWGTPSRAELDGQAQASGRLDHERVVSWCEYERGSYQ
jgi:hypothetical protein